MGFRLLFAVCLCALAAEQTALPAKIYDVDDAYQIYSLLLRGEESYRFAKGTLVIQKETERSRNSPNECVSPEVATCFNEAIADYNRLMHSQWLLQRKFQIEKRYELLGSSVIANQSKEGGWEGFYKLHADSGGYSMVSAVGFNKERTRAIVYMGSACGGTCGSWRYHLLEKIQGNWKEVPGITCFMVSQE